MRRERTRSLSTFGLWVYYETPTGNGLKAFEKSFSVFTLVKFFLGGPLVFFFGLAARKRTCPQEFATSARLSDPFGLLLDAALPWRFFVSGLIIPIVVFLFAYVPVASLMAFAFHNLFSLFLFSLVSSIPLLILPGSDPIWCGSAFSFARASFTWWLNCESGLFHHFFSFFFYPL
jgi:hypothetical protein